MIPTVMRPDSFVDYYQYLLSAQPELEEDAGIYTDEDKLRRMVPQESLEQLVCPRFGVSEERVRESSFYDAGEEAYELTGIGSAWTCQILSAEQQGEELRMQFVMLDSHDLPMSYGTLTAELADDGFQYRSMEREDYPSFQLEYPMAYDGTYSDGKFLWDTSAGTAQRPDPATGEERVWRGDSWRISPTFTGDSLQPWAPPARKVPARTAGALPAATAAGRLRFR